MQVSDTANNNCRFLDGSNNDGYRDGSDHCHWPLYPLQLFRDIKDDTKKAVIFKIKECVAKFKGTSPYKYRVIVLPSENPVGFFGRMTNPCLTLKYVCLPNVLV